MATVFVVRHGEAEGNGEHRFIGQMHVALTERGSAQALATAKRLVGMGITRIVSSDLVRTIDTMAPLAHQVGIGIEADPRLREIDNGEWTGLLPAEIAAQWPEMWAEYAGGADVTRPGGERWTDVAARVIPVVENLLAGDGRVVVGTHGGPVLLTALWAAGILDGGNIFRGRLAAVDNASVTIIDSGPRLIAFNDIGHLGTTPDLRLPFEPA